MTTMPPLRGTADIYEGGTLLASGVAYELRAEASRRGGRVFTGHLLQTIHERVGVIDVTLRFEDGTEMPFFLEASWLHSAGPIEPD